MKVLTLNQLRLNHRKTGQPVGAPIKYRIGEDGRKIFSCSACRKDLTSLNCNKSIYSNGGYCRDCYANWCSANKDYILQQRREKRKQRQIDEKAIHDERNRLLDEVEESEQNDRSQLAKKFNDLVISHNLKKSFIAIQIGVSNNDIWKFGTGQKLSPRRTEKIVEFICILTGKSLRD